MNHPEKFDPQIYGTVFSELMKEKRLNSLGPGTPNTEARPKLSAMDIGKMFMPHKIADENMAQACLAAVWLYLPPDQPGNSHRCRKLLARHYPSPGRRFLEQQILVPAGGKAPGF